MLHNTSVKSYASIPAFLISAGFHAGLLVSAVPQITVAYARSHGGQPTQALQNAVLGFAISWCVVISVWSALAANVLHSSSNKWGGLHGLRLVGIVVGLTLTLDLANSMCLFGCPATALALPILTYVALYNNSMPPATDEPTKMDEPPAHG
jgi:hypothetical protein